jgi:SAM-dependent methyltransferase
MKLFNKNISHEFRRVNLNRWKNAQTKEEAHYRSRKVRWESTESWGRFLMENFSINFEFFKDKRILEIGCGAFGIIHYINVPCYKVRIDPLCSIYKGLNDEYTTQTYQITSTGEYLPFKNDVFDVILSLNVLDHCFNPLNVLKEANRVLKRDGIFLLYLYTFDLPRAIRLRLTLFDGPHPYHFNHVEIATILKSYVK